MRIVRVVTPPSCVWRQALRPLSPSPTMKSFAALLALVSIVAAVPAAYNEQIPLGEQATYPGFSLDLNARRLVQMDGQEPIWMTELEKVASYCFT